MELLEEKAINRNLDRQLRRLKKEVAALTDERQALYYSNAELRQNQAEAIALLKKLGREGRRQSQVLTKTSVLLSSEREIRMHAEKQLGRCQNMLRKQDASTKSSKTDTEVDQVPCPSQIDLVEQVRKTLTGAVSSWVSRVQGGCCDGIEEAEVLSWLLHKVFFLCAELIEERRESIVSVFRGRRAGTCDEDDNLDPSTAAFMHRHLCRHYLTLFPLSGGELEKVHEKIAWSLTKSMMDSTEWSRMQHDSKAIVQELLQSGLREVVTEYLGIMVWCCLQQPPVTFTDDLGKLQRYDPDIHAEPVNGETSEGDWCIVIFPALVLAGEWGDHEPIDRRYVISKSR